MKKIIPLLLFLFVCIINAEQYSQADKKKFIESTTKYQEEENKRNNVPIHHIGKVVDQNSVPVVGAKIKARITRWRESIWEMMLDGEKDGFTLLRDDLNYEFTTDEKGEFIIKDVKGSAVSVSEIEKEGYITPKLIENHFVEYKLADVDYNQVRVVEYKIWQSEGKEKILVRNTELVIKFAPEKQNKEKIINFVTDQTSSYYREKGNLKIKCDNEGADGNNINFTWWCEISAVNGGVQEKKDTSRQGAPVKNYLDKIIYKKEKESKDWKQRIISPIYFTNGNEIYGEVELWFGANKNGNIKIYFVYVTMNPNGSPNLEKGSDNIIYVN